MNAAATSPKRLAVLAKLSRGEELETDERYTAMNMEDDGLGVAGWVSGRPTGVLSPSGRKALRNAR